MTESDRGTATLLARLGRARIGEDRARSWIEQGVVKVAGETVSDADAVVPWPTAWTLSPS
ncbi:hypothetical protein [Actinomycetospora flava]|uniref:RNA-binding S4 domain-containing protein n=1 Tax=Actinomycetospora flava TaxID=3129232 RepID=A0ABU8MDC9_9PSEU